MNFAQNTPFRVSLTALAATVAAACAATPAHASATQESMFQDDSLLVYSSPSQVDKGLRELRNLGVDRIRASVYWRLVAPEGSSTTRPSFEATDPAAYPAIHWQRYDTLVRLAAKYDIAVNFNVTSPAPSWATGDPARSEIEKTYYPDATEFGRFLRALGTRYSGSYVPPEPSPSDPAEDDPPQRFPFPSSNPPPAEPAASAPQTPLPRVGFWSIWNEPNQGGWLTPQWIKDPNRRNHWVDVAPKIYRELVDHAYQGLLETGHENDTIVIGDLAPKGADRRGETRPIKALRFVRTLFCVGSDLRPLRGEQAAARGCPQAGEPAFVSQHPALFKVTGWAHHPYSLVTPPAFASALEPDYVTLADLPRLQRTLLAIYRTYGQPRNGPVPIWLTEYGYQTNPPDPFNGYSLSKQATYLNQADYMAYKYPWVVSAAQFLLDDDKPFTQFPQNTYQYWGTFQTGLIGLDGKKKPSYEAYRLPIHVPTRSRRRGSAFRIWGQLRMAPNNSQQTARVQFRPRGKRGRWRTVSSVAVTNEKGFFETRKRLGRSGLLRIAWYPDAADKKKRFLSRSVGVRVRR